MPNVDFSQLHDHVVPALPGADTPIVNYHIRRAVREFLKRTCIWREQVAQFNVTPGVAGYALSSSDPAAEVCEVLSVVLDGKQLGVVSDRDRVAYGVTSDRDFPRGWSRLTPRVVTFSEAPLQAYPCNIEVALTVTQNPAVTQMPDFLVQDYVEAMADGAKASAMLMAGKPWTNPQLGEFHGTRFKLAVNALRAQINDGGRVNVHRFTGPRFGA